MTGNADIRAGDADRDRVADRLRQAVSEGRISLDELNERLDRTYAARTIGELEAVVADLPKPVVPVTGELSVPASAAPEHTLSLRTEHWRVRQDGAWVVPPRIDIRLGVWGTATIDFLAARCPHREVLIDVRITSWFGDVHMKVPHGWRVRSDELSTPGLGRLHDSPVDPLADDGVVLRLAGVSRGDIWVRYRDRRR